MTSWDYFVGFEKEPENLDAFLEEQGYDLTTTEQDSPDRDWESREGGLVNLFYFFKAPKTGEGEVPNWAESGYNVVSELMISTKEFDAVDEALRIAEETTREYDGIFCEDSVL